MKGRTEMRNRTLLIGIASAIVITAPSLAGAARVPHRARTYRISETQHIATIGSTGQGGTPAFRLINVGTIDGTVGTQPIHGAIRANGQLTGAHTSIVRGTEFDAHGSRHFVLDIRFTIAGALITDHGTGTWSGGTGTYRNARGSFTINGTHPTNGTSTIQLRGNITY
jgi:hypothetical protein